MELRGVKECIAAAAAGDEPRRILRLFSIRGRASRWCVATTREKLLLFRSERRRGLGRGGAFELGDGDASE